MKKLFGSWTKYKILLWILLSVGTCFGQGLRGKPNVSSDLAAQIVANAGNSSAIYNVIVQFASPPAASDLAQVRAHASGGGPDWMDLSAINSVYLSLNGQALAALQNNSKIAYITPDRNLQPRLDIDNSATGAAIAYSYGYTGAGVGIAIVDSGILLPQNDLLGSNGKSRVVYSQSFVPTQTGTSDQYGHGTHVTGIAAANGANSTGPGYFKTFQGVAPGANIINLRVLDQNGAGTDSSVISAISTAIKLKNTYNIRVINLSIGRPVYESYQLDPLCQAVEKAWQAGIVVVVAAGNDGRNNTTNGYATVNAPGNDPLVITVGAMKNLGTVTRVDDLIASYSSKGPTLLDHIVKPDLVAPGNKTVSLMASRGVIENNSTIANLVPLSYYKTTNSTAASNNYVRMSGTSMAAPLVSGAAALIIGREPAVSPDTVKARLMTSATKTFPSYSTATDSVTGATYTSQYDIFTVGAGYLDIWGALSSGVTVPSGSSAASPTAVFYSATNTVTIAGSSPISGTAAVWGSNGVFSAAAVWGSSVFINGAAAVWGSTTNLWGTAAVWGSSAVAGNAAVWGSVAVWGSTTGDGGESLSLLVNGEN